MITFSSFLKFLLPKIQSIAPITALGIGTGVGGVLNYLGAKEAADAQQAGLDQASAATREMFDISREDLLPFLQEATGQPVMEQFVIPTPGSTAFNWTYDGLGNRIPRTVSMAGQYPEGLQVGDTFGGQTIVGFDEQGQPLAARQVTDEFGRPVTEGGALQEFRAGIDQAPGVPGIPDFEGRFADMGRRFTGDRFTYDPYEAMQSPDIQFLQQQGEQALLRQTARNRRLGSGNRLLDFMKFNQGLASQGLQDYFNRKYTQSRENYQRALGEDESAYGRSLTEYGLDLGDYERNRQNILDRYALATGAHDTRMGRLGDLINVGSGAGGMTAGTATATGRTLSDIYADRGAAGAAGTLGRYGAIGQGIGDLAMLYGMSKSPYMKDFFGG